MTSTHQKTTLAILTGLTLAGTLAGCAAEETAAAKTDAVEEETATPTPTGEATTDAPTEAPASTYTDGTYTASGSYQAPSGTESIDVTGPSPTISSRPSRSGDRHPIPRRRSTSRGSAPASPR